MTDTLTTEKIQRAIDATNRQGLGTYWDVNRPTSTLKLSGAARYVNSKRLNPIDRFDQFVYWPDYKVAGTIRDIVRRFREAGINQVNVGTLYALSNGRIGCVARTASLTYKVVAACAFNPLDPTHNELLSGLVAQDTMRDLVNFQNTQRVNQVSQSYQPFRQGEFTPEQRQEARRMLLQQYPRPTDQSIYQGQLQSLQNELANYPAWGAAFPGGQQWQQQAQQARQGIANELSLLPPLQSGYPGGSEYLNTAARNVDIFGTQLPTVQSPGSPINVTGSSNGTFQRYL